MSQGSCSSSGCDGRNGKVGMGSGPSLHEPRRDPVL
jgi:hypothetical protein